MLLQEEQYIIHWLTEYGPLPKAANCPNAEGQTA